MPSAVPQPGAGGGTEQELAAKVAASFEVPKPPQVTQPEVVQGQPDHQAEAAATKERLEAVQDTIKDLPDQVQQVVSAPARQVGKQILDISHPDDAERSIRELMNKAKGPADIQAGVNQLRPAHIEAHHDLGQKEQVA